MNPNILVICATVVVIAFIFAALIYGILGEKNR